MSTLPPQSLKTESDVHLKDGPGQATEELIHVFGSSLGDEEMEEIRDCLQQQWIGIGAKTAALEAGLAEHLGVADFVLLNSGTNSLQMAIHLLDLPPGTGAEVILPSFTWVGCANAVLLCGHRPVFCDVNLDTMNLDSASVERVLTERTAAILVVHHAGLPAAVDELAKFELPIIEDAAHAIDSRLKDRACGTWGDIGIFSFDSVKNLAMGEGGGLVAQNASQSQLARSLRQCGIARSGYESAGQRERWWEHEILAAFPKMTPSDVCAAIGLAQLRKLQSLQKRREFIWNYYQRELGDLDWLRCPVESPAGDRHSYFTYCVRVVNGTRDQLAHYLLKQGIYTTLRFHPLHLSVVYDCRSRLPVTERLMLEALNLPLHPRLSDFEVDRVVSAVRKFRA